MKMLIIVDYPGLDFSFYIRKELNTLEEKTNKLHSVMKRKGIEVDNHYITDLVVEDVFSNKKAEIWIVGS
jgi:hypothetical protein